MPLQTISTLQLALFAAAWLLLARLGREHRAAPLHWAAACGLHALALPLLALGPAWARGAAAPLLMGGFVLALRGIEVFASGQSTRDRLWLALVASVGSVVAATPLLPLAGALQLGLQVTALHGAAALLLLGTLPWLWRVVVGRFGRGAALLAVLPGAVAGCLQGALAFWLAFVSPPPAALALAATLAAATLANLCLLGLVIAGLVQRLHHTATHDHLTGAVNRRAGEAALNAALDRHRRDGQGLSLIAVDLDHFRQVNDERGHAAGDRALVFAAEVLRKAVRSYDSVVRWGGEEFVVVLPGAPAAAAAELAERMRGQIETRAPATLGHTLTVSLGVAAADVFDTTGDQLTDRADRALQRAKAEGRNRVCSGDAPPPAPEAAPDTGPDTQPVARGRSDPEDEGDDPLDGPLTRPLPELLLGPEDRYR